MVWVLLLILIVAIAFVEVWIYLRLARFERRLLTQRARLDVQETHLNAHSQVLRIHARRLGGQVVYETEEAN